MRFSFRGPHGRSDLTKEERDRIPAKYFAKPPDGFPCDTQAHLNAAVKLLGREPESEQPAIKKRMIEIAKELALDLPDTWKDDSSMSSAGMAAEDMSFANISPALLAALGNDPDADGDEDSKRGSPTFRLRLAQAG